ncbi:MAG: hypothetical protein M1130_05160 [Actinobacteria bacterium]|nr:hypothetical protein [Actinomycetota bacterium]
MMDQEVISLRNELLEGTASVADANNRIIAICRLARAERYRGVSREVLKRAIFTACILATKGRESHSNLGEGVGQAVCQGMAAEEPAPHCPAGQEAGCPVRCRMS